MKPQSRCAKRKVGCVVGNAKGTLVGWGCNHGTLEECTCKHDAKNPNVRHAEVMAIGSASEKFGQWCDVCNLWALFGLCPCNR